MLLPSDFLSDGCRNKSGNKNDNSSNVLIEWSDNKNLARNSTPTEVEVSGLFYKEQLKRSIVVLCGSNAFRGTNNVNPKHYQTNNLHKKTVHRNWFTLSGTLRSTTDIKRLYYNSLNALAYVESCHGIPLNKVSVHFYYCFWLDPQTGGTPSRTYSTVNTDSARNIFESVLYMTAY